MDTLLLHLCKIHKSTALTNRAHTVFHSLAVLAMIYYRVSSFLFQSEGVVEIPVVPWLLVFSSELMLSFLWFLNTAYGWSPVSRTVFPERLPPDEDLPAIDVFVCTADPEKEPPLDVMNTVLSAMALDYPPEKLSVYLSDDAGSSLTLYAIHEAWSFARAWIPFCRRYAVQTRCPKACGHDGGLVSCR